MATDRVGGGFRDLLKKKTPKKLSRKEKLANAKRRAERKLGIPLKLTVNPFFGTPGYHFENK